MRLERSTVKNNLEDVRRFLKISGYMVSDEYVKQYLEGYLSKSRRTYNSQITSLRRFIRDFLKLPHVIMSFKMAPIDDSGYWRDLPSKEQVRKGFYGLSDTRAKAIYLFTATTRARDSSGLVRTGLQPHTTTQLGSWS